jgi:hypothetical protein
LMCITLLVIWIWPSLLFSHGISQQLMDVSPSYRHFQMISKREIHLDIYRLVVYIVRVSFFVIFLCLVAFFRSTCKHWGEMFALSSHALFCEPARFYIDEAHFHFPPYHVLSLGVYIL